MIVPLKPSLPDLYLETLPLWEQVRQFRSAGLLMRELLLDSRTLGGA